MKLLINASNLRFGGGKTVGINIINYYIERPEIDKLVVIIPTTAGYERFKSDSKVEIIVFPSLLNVSLFKILSNYLILPLILLFTRPDFILSLGNVAIPTSRRQFLLIHQAFLAYPESIVWRRIAKDDKRFYLYITNMLRLIKANLKYASVFGVQTEAMRGRISKLYKIPLSDIEVIPNAISFTNTQMAEKQFSVRKQQEIKLLFLSKYYPHKNFEILYEVGKIVAERKLPIRISVTIDAAENDGSRKFLNEIEQLGLTSIIHNLGNIPLERISEVYEIHDGLFLPTLLESFSGSYIEAMHFGKPVFTSDMDFAREVCKDVAYYFDPLNANDIVNKILDAFHDIRTLERKVLRGKELISASSSWNDIGKFIDQKILKLV